MKSWSSSLLLLCCVRLGRPLTGFPIETSGAEMASKLKISCWPFIIHLCDPAMWTGEAYTLNELMVSRLIRSEFSFPVNYAIPNPDLALNALILSSGAACAPSDLLTLQLDEECFHYQPQRLKH